MSLVGMSASPAGPPSQSRVVSLFLVMWWAMGGQFRGFSLEPPARVSYHVTGGALGWARAGCHLLVPGVGAYCAQVFPSPSPSCRSPLRGLFLEMASARALICRGVLALVGRGSHCPSTAGWSSVFIIIGAVVTGHVLSLVPRVRFSSLGLAADAGLPVFLGAGGAAGLAWFGEVGAAPALAKLLGFPPAFLRQEAAVLPARGGLVSLPVVLLAALALGLLCGLGLCS